MYAFGPESIVVQKVIEAAQLPIAAPPLMEIAVIAKECGLSTAQVEDVIFEFCKRRNAAIQPKPVDPLREKIIAALDKLYLNKESSKIADAVLAAIGKVK